MPRVELLPAGKVLEVPKGTALRNLLFQEGVEFPCGGNGRCQGCRVKLLEGDLPATGADLRKLAAEDLRRGWRLACQAVVQEDLKLEVAQWELPVLGDDRSLAFPPKDSVAVAVDLGTTTVVAQLVDLWSGSVLAVCSSLNAQAQHGADLMTRIEFALGGGATRLTGLVREQMGGMIAELSTKRSGRLRQVVVVGNSVMHHLLAGLSVEPFAQYPFQSSEGGLQEFDAAAFGWPMAGVRVSLLPCLGGLVGSDLLAGILATQLHQSDQPVALIDLGTNGEIVVGNKDRILCTSTAAGPAFEGARIAMGMRAAKGAISRVSLLNRMFECEVLGGGQARGICGSGLVDAAAAGLELGVIQPNGRLTSGTALHLSGAVSLSQKDIRELQLAKGAIAAGLEMVARQWGVRCDELRALYLAGAFGNYVNQSSARRIGLLPLAPKTVISAGNAALHGAKLALFREDLRFADILGKVAHVALNEDAAFQDRFVEQMLFPASNSSLTEAA